MRSKLGLGIVFLMMSGATAKAQDSLPASPKAEQDTEWRAPRWRSHFRGPAVRYRMNYRMNLDRPRIRMNRVAPRVRMNWVEPRVRMRMGRHFAREQARWGRNFARQQMRYEFRRHRPI